MSLWKKKIEILEPERDDLTKVASFLSSCGLRLEQGLEKTVVIKQEDKIIGTGSIEGKVLKCIAVAPEFRGAGILNTIITKLKKILFKQDQKRSFVYTKREYTNQFQSLGFKKLAGVGDYPIFLEDDTVAGIEDFQTQLKGKVDKKTVQCKMHNWEKKQTAALVMNCNPLTKGHLYLIKKAAAENELVFIFILREDRSFFPFQVRYELVKQGVKELENVLVFSGGDYVLSYATFPNYFLNQSEEKGQIEQFSALDAQLFGKYIAKLLAINKRYVGNEPYSEVTSIYNQALQEYLFQYGVQVKKIKRKEFKGQPISASRVREYIKAGNWEEIKEIVPAVTYNFLKNKVNSGGGLNES